MVTLPALALVWHAFRLNAQLNAVMRDPSVPARVTWRVETEGGVSSSPVYNDGTIYLDSNGASLYAIDYRSGAIRWRFRADNMLMSAPLIAGGTIIVSSGDALQRTWDPPHYVVLGAGSNTIYGIDAITGRARWQLPIAGTGMPTGVLAAGLFIHLSGTGTVIALDPQTGRVRWQTNIASTANMTEPVDLGDGTILLSGGFPNAVYRMRAKDGSIVWSHRFPDCAAGFTDQPVAADAERVYGGYLKLDSSDPRCFGVYSAAVQHAYALNARSGALLWDHALSHGIVPPRNEGAIPLVHDGTVYIGSAVAPEMHALDAKTGRVLWRRRVHGAVKGGSVLVNGRLYFGDLGGTLWALDPKTGAIRGTLEAHVPFNVGSPIVVNGTLIDGSKRGTILAMPLDRIR